MSGDKRVQWKNVTASICLSVLLAVLSTPRVQALECYGDTADFESGLPSDWEVVDSAGTGVVWTTLDFCGEANYINASSEVACVSSDRFGEAEYDVSLVSPLFSLVGATSATLSFEANYRPIAGDNLDVEISLDNGDTWEMLESFDGVLGEPFSRPGEAINLDLTPYLGAPLVKLRWRYFDPGIDDWGFYAQLDNIALECEGGADITLTTESSPAAVVEGELFTHSFNFRNNGPGEAETTAVLAPYGLYSNLIPLELQTSKGSAGLVGGGAAALFELGALGVAELVTGQITARAEMPREAALRIDAPHEISGVFETVPAAFGPELPVRGVSGELVLTTDAVGPAHDGCQPLLNAAALEGKIAVMQVASACSNTDQAERAQDAGAVAVVVLNPSERPYPFPTLIGFHDGITIPMLSINKSDSEIIIPFLLDGIEATLLPVFSPSYTVQILTQGISIEIDSNPRDNGGAAELTILRDTDGDGVADLDDNCPAAANLRQSDSDGDGIGDACDDFQDRDDDGIADADDNCPAAANARQNDADRDGLGDACDDLQDRDDDGVADADDNCPAADNGDQSDADNDGIGDACDDLQDQDGDGTADADDNCPAADNAAQTDADGDGVGDACDTCTDSDGDGAGDPGYAANTCDVDQCPADEDKTAPGACGCGSADQDQNDNGIIDCRATAEFNYLISQSDQAVQALALAVLQARRQPRSRQLVRQAKQALRQVLQALAAYAESNGAAIDLSDPEFDLAAQMQSTVKGARKPLRVRAPRYRRRIRKARRTLTTLASALQLS